MLSENDKQNLVRNLVRGRVTLVTGAGFSADATNISGARLPIGNQLAQSLWKFLYETDHDGKTSLKTLYAAAQTHRKGNTALREFLVSQLCVAEFPAWYLAVANWFWRRVYTFNADDLASTESEPLLVLMITSLRLLASDNWSTSERGSDWSDSESRA
jgi:hypothetical protein